MSEVESMMTTDETGNPLAVETLDPKGLWFSDPKVACVVGSALHKNFYPAWTSWEVVPFDDRDLMWLSFRDHYKWVPRNAICLKEAFHQTCKNRFRDDLFKRRSRVNVNLMKRPKATEWEGPQYAKQILEHGVKPDGGRVRTPAEILRCLRRPEV